MKGYCSYSTWITDKSTLIHYLYTFDLESLLCTHFRIYFPKPYRNRKKYREKKKRTVFSQWLCTFYPLHGVDFTLLEYIAPLFHLITPSRASVFVFFSYTRVRFYSCRVISVISYIIGPIHFNPTIQSNTIFCISKQKWYIFLTRFRQIKIKTKYIRPPSSFLSTLCYKYAASYRT